MEPPSTPPAIVYIEGSNTNLQVSSGSTATWHNNTVYSGISYTNGANHGFFPLNNVLVTTYDITYELNGGSIATTAPTSYYGLDLPLLIPDAFGVFEFAGWDVVFSGGSSVSGVVGYEIPVGSYGDVILTATWADGVYAEYAIGYVLGDGSLPVGAPTSYDGSVLALLIPDAFGVYVFDGWSVACANGTVVVVSDGFSILEGTYGDLVLTALWDTATYAHHIVYVLDGGTDDFGNPSLYTVADLPLVIVDPTRAGYTFLGWVVEYADGRTVGMVRAFSVPKGTLGDLVLTAHWFEEVPVAEYTVTYNGNGYTNGTVPIDNSSPYLSGSQVTVLDQHSLSRNGHTFLGWALSPDVDTPPYLVGSTFTITDNVVLYAVWQIVSYSVSYQPGAHGTFDEQITTDLFYGDPAPDEPEISGEFGWTFTGWSPLPDAIVTDNAVYVAQWDPELFMVWFVDWDGRTLKSEVVPYGGSASAPSNPYRAGYTFTGWSRNFTNVVFSITVVAQYRWIDTGVATPTPTVKPSPTTTPPVTISPSPTASVAVSPSPLPPSPSGESWAFVNLVLSVTGVILAGLGAIWLLLQKGNVDHKLPRNVWIVAAFVLGVVGLTVFFLTSDLSQSMVMLNNWTAIYAVIFIVQLVCLTLAFKHKKTVPT